MDSGHYLQADTIFTEIVAKDKNWNHCSTIIKITLDQFIKLLFHVTLPIVISHDSLYEENDKTL